MLLLLPLCMAALSIAVAGDALGAATATAGGNPESDGTLRGRPSRQRLPLLQGRSAALPAHALRPSCPWALSPHVYTARERKPIAIAW